MSLSCEKCYLAGLDYCNCKEPDSVSLPVDKIVMLPDIIDILKQEKTACIYQAWDAKKKNQPNTYEYFKKMVLSLSQLIRNLEKAT